MWASRPWAGHVTPAILEIPFEPAEGGKPEKIMKPDPFHVLKVGVLREFVGSLISVFCLLGYFDHRGDLCNYPARLSRAYALFNWFCSGTGKKAAMRSFTKMNLNVAAISRSFPWLNCKGSDTILVIKWLLFFVKNTGAKEGHERLFRIVRAVYLLSTYNFANCLKGPS
jgi:hypothetical protein